VFLPAAVFKNPREYKHGDCTPPQDPFRVEEKKMLTQLSLKVGTSRGRDTYGWTMVTLIVNSSGKRYRARGGGYDMYGTVIAGYLESTFQDRLRVIAAHALSNDAPSAMSDRNTYCIFDRDLYGIYLNLSTGAVTLDGGCGLASMMRIAKQIGISIIENRLTCGKKRVRTTGYTVEDSGMPVLMPVIRPTPV